MLGVEAEGWSGPGELGATWMDSISNRAAASGGTIVSDQ